MYVFSVNSTTLDVPVSQYDKIVYKFVYVKDVYGAGEIVDPGSVRWQEGDNRVLDLREVHRDCGDHLIVQDTWGKESFEAKWLDGRKEEEEEKKKKKKKGGGWTRVRDWLGGGGGRGVADSEGLEEGGEEDEEDPRSKRLTRTSARRLLSEYKAERLERIGGGGGGQQQFEHAELRHVGQELEQKYMQLSRESQVAVVRALSSTAACAALRTEADDAWDALQTRGDGWNMDEELRNVEMDRLIASCPLDTIVDAIDDVERAAAHPVELDHDDADHV